ncbi:MAG TPA: ankyrin repeat domain-containing protein [Phycisphaerae bacterium]|nr:ankyrin repeat domain-containing protein [Phycisphaerae bacterium]
MTRSTRSQLAVVCVALAIAVIGLAVRGFPPQADLHTAAQAGSLNQVNRCIAWGVDVNSTGAMTFTPLHEAAFQGHADVAEALLAAGADVDAITAVHVPREAPRPPPTPEFGAPQWPVEFLSPPRETPLYWAVCRGHGATVRVLLEHGANPNITVLCKADEEDETPLRAALGREDHEVEALLREHGAAK